MLPLERGLRLLARTTTYEVRKATAYRAGFIVRELLRGLERPLLMIAVYTAMFRANGAADINGFSHRDLVQYLLLVATLQKIVFHFRGLDVAEQIFDGYITKYRVMPFAYFVLPLGRFAQHTLTQVAFAVPVYGVGLLLVPGWWPRPVSLMAAGQALILVLLGSYCAFLVYFIINLLAFWLDVIWTLLGGAHFIIEFCRGVLIPVAIMPAALADVLRWTFAYWALSAPIELFLGRLGSADFARGVVILLVSAAALDWLRRFVWRRGTRRYTGAGM